MTKKIEKLISISELSKKLNLVNPKNNKPLNHVLRYWESEFIEIKPELINKRRYYSLKQVEIINFINFLLKKKGMTINGAKNVLKSKINQLDDYELDSLKTDYYKRSIKEKTKNIFNKIKKLKKYGKKITYKSKDGS